MTVFEMYERVNLTLPLEQRKFLSYLNDTVIELAAMYENVTVGKAQITRVDSLNDSLAINPLYHVAIADNILFLAGAGEMYKGEFIRKAELAYKKNWNSNAKNKRIKRNRW